jgi:acetylornithine deacetylase
MPAASLIPEITASTIPMMGARAPWVISGGHGAGVGVDSLDLLETLIGFPTVSLSSNHALADFVTATLTGFGVEVTKIEGPHASGLNLYATIGPRDRGGVVLSGHTDVVPVEGQAWASDPFRLTRRGDRLYGRGTADMKGFLACAIRAATLASARDLKTPLHLAFSCDEEIGCVGVRPLLDRLALVTVRPIACIVGEPTSMRLAIGHKGKIALAATCRGRAGHSALAPRLLNPIGMASELIQAVAALQARVEREGPRDPAYDVPYATLHVGRIRGGEALNVVPTECEVELEIRSAEPGEALLEAVRAAAAAIVLDRRQRFGEADIAIAVTNAYPGLDAPPDDPAAALVRHLIGANETIKVAFGTEGGLYRERLRVPTVICGPGSMDQGHKPDEYITIEQMERCDAMMDALVDHLCAD